MDEEVAASHKRSVNQNFRLHPDFCRGGWYVDRNKALLEFVDGMEFKHVLELAGGSGLMAEMFLDRHPEVESYRLIDYSEEACKLATLNLKRFPEKQTEVQELDLLDLLDRSPTEDWDLLLVGFDSADLVICTGMEHFPRGFDVRVLSRMRLGAHVLWSLSSFGTDSGTHLNPYSSADYVRGRVEDRLDVWNLEHHPGAAKSGNAGVLLLSGVVTGGSYLQ